MNTLSLNGTIDQERDTSARATSAANLVASLREIELALLESIRAEEERTSLADQNDPCYSMLAHSMRARVENLKLTIATLEATRQAA
jgi:hypothetical protein